jgi:hypothetical protein
MESSEDEREPAHEFPVSDRAARASASLDDEDEDMSSDAEASSSDGSDADAMDDVALDAPATAPLVASPLPSSASGELPPIPEGTVSSPGATPPPSSPAADVSESPRSRPRSAHSRRSTRRQSRQDSLLLNSATLPVGERLKQKYLQVGVLPVMLVRYPRFLLQIIWPIEVLDIGFVF